MVFSDYLYCGACNINGGPAPVNVFPYLNGGPHVVGAVCARKDCGRATEERNFCCQVCWMLHVLANAIAGDAPTPRGRNRNADAALVLSAMDVVDASPMKPRIPKATFSRLMDALKAWNPKR